MKPQTIIKHWRELLVGQNQAIDTIMPYINRFSANLHLEGRPVANIYLVGPTGTGKTKTPEALAEVLHGSEKNVLRIDCGAYSLEHEVAKLIGAPPGYLGHRETPAILSQKRINELATEKCKLSIVIWDEIEKASSSMWKLILGIMDKAEVPLGDGSTTNFESCINFFTSKLGAEKMWKALNGSFGFHGALSAEDSSTGNTIDCIGRRSVEKGFSPEFYNRIDETISYSPLTHLQLVEIANIELNKLNHHIASRLTEAAFQIVFQKAVLVHFANLGNDPKYGARYLKRSIEHFLFDPLCIQFLNGAIPPNSLICVSVGDNKLIWTVEPIVMAPVVAPIKATASRKT
jgi:ATP-dependent Clp protease ATP-binding subunit ClpA